MTATLDVIGQAVAARLAADPWLRPCGSCDGGLPMTCTHPDGDPRAVIQLLVDALAESGRLIERMTDEQQRARA